MNTDGSDFQYDLLQGLGRSTIAEGQSNGHANQEEQYISLLDFMEDNNKDAPKVDQLPKPEEPTAKPSTEQTYGPRKLPWARASETIRSPSLRLHNEIVEFCRFLEPTPDEVAVRQEALVRISEVIKEIFPSAVIQLFGSFVTGLYLPTSDMDLVVTNSGCHDIPSALKAIGNALVEAGMGKKIQVIAKAKVPIVKFEDMSTGLAFDVSFDVANGPKTAEYVVKLMKGLPGMNHLVKILKLFLQQRELNEVYSGGIGSYALLVMVAAFMMQHPSRYQEGHLRKPTGQIEGNLGILLLDFLRLYGRTLDYEHVVVSCRKDGVFYPKKDKPKFIQATRFYLAVEDPQDSDNDLAKGSFNISRVQKAFDFAYKQLTSPIDPSDSALERIIRLDGVLMSRTPAEPIQASATTPLFSAPKWGNSRESDGLTKKQRNKFRSAARREAQRKAERQAQVEAESLRKKRKRERASLSPPRRKRPRDRDF